MKVAVRVKRGWWALVLLLPLLAGACQDYSFAYRPNQRVAATTIREVVVRNSDTDILFVIDNSGSMFEEQVRLVQNTVLFIDELARSQNNYRVGIVTTNALDESIDQQTIVGTDGGRLRLRPATSAELVDNNPDFGLTDPISGNPVDLGLDLNCGAIAENPGTVPYLDRPDLEATDLTEQRCRLIKDFIATVASLGVGGSGREAGLEAAKRALDPNGDVDVVNNNAGFLRSEADLALIFLTDEDDCSYPDYAGSPWPNPTCYEDIANAVPVDAYVSFFANLKSDNAGIGNVRAALIGGGAFSGEGGADFVPSGCRETVAGPSADCGCWSSSTDSYFCQLLLGYGHVCADTTGCNNVVNGAFPYCAPTPGGSCIQERCSSMPSTRYSQFIDSLVASRREAGFPRGVYEDSICQPNYDDTLEEIAISVVLSGCFTLDVVPDSADNVQLILAQTDPETDITTERVIPYFDPSDPEAACQNCGDCAEGGWEFSSTGICLACGLSMDTGDDFQLTIIDDIVGLEGSNP